MSANILFKNREFNGVRLTYKRTDGSSDIDTNYGEGRGDRFYYSILESDITQMEAATFNSFISVTQSGDVTHYIELVPMLPGELVDFNLTVSSINEDSTKGFISNPRGGFIHTGSVIKPIGGSASLSYDIKSDFSSVDTHFHVNGTQSISIAIVGESGEDLDWNLFIDYKKSFHSISSPTQSQIKPIYPR